jgi:hypothetical protein
MPETFPVDLNLDNQKWALIRRCTVCEATKRTPKVNGEQPIDPTCRLCDRAGLQIIYLASDEALGKKVTELLSTTPVA